MTPEAIRDYLKHYDGPDIHIMEVCGSHTAAIAKNGIPSLLSDKIHLISGPGCPVCVTPSAYVDRLIELALTPHHTVVTFGDLLRIPGSHGSLSEAKSQGADVRMVYSPFDAVDMAEQAPERTFVYAAVGFETTTPVYAMMLDEIIEKAIHNLKFLTAIKTMPEVIDKLCGAGADIQGFLAPGHVAVVTGSHIFRPLAEKWQLPFVVSGFEGQQLLEAIYALVKAQGQGGVYNLYPQVVSEEGNAAARARIAHYFDKADAVWRGIGVVSESGRLLKPAYRELDAGSYGLDEDNKINKACRCDQILIGRKSPMDCPLFGKVCTPLTPQGACMVSSEGSCHSYFIHHRV